MWEYGSLEKIVKQVRGQFILDVVTLLQVEFIITRLNMLSEQYLISMLHYQFMRPHIIAQT